MTSKAPKIVVGVSSKDECRSRIHRKTGTAPLLLSVALLLFLTLMPLSAWASTSYVDGISDQHLYNWEGGISSLFGNAWVGSPPSHIKLARYVVQWNVMSGGGYTNEYANFRSWYERAGQLGLVREVALADFTGANEPPSSTYKTELENLLTAFNGISYVEAWNEPNHQSSAVKFYVKAVAAAHYMNAAYSACQVHVCTAIAGDFLDESNMSGYEAEYISGSNLSPKDPPNWGMHPYAAVDTEKTTTVEAFRNGLPGKGSENISFTEVGAYYCKKGESVSGSENASREAYQAKHAAYLVNTLIPHTTNLEHVFYYEFAFEGTKRINCSNVEDTELYAPSSEGQASQPRSAASIVWGPEGPPSASTGNSSNVAPLQATLSGEVNPQGLADTKYYFRYGTNTEYRSGSTIPGDAGQSLNWQSESAPISGLQPGTTYHFLIVATNEDGTKEGKDKEFTTPGPVEAVTTEASSVYQTQAQLNGTVNPQGYDAKYYFQYGETSAYGMTTAPEGDAGSGSSAVPESAIITGLEPGTTYHYRLVATSGGVTREGKDVTFITPFVVAFQAGGALWTYSSVSGTLDTYDSMTAGTSPSVAALPGGGYVVAFQAGGALWTYSSVSGTLDTYDSMTAGTSPSVAALPGGGYVVAFQAGGALWTYSSVSGTLDTYDSMTAGTSPSVAALPGGGYVVAFQAGGALWTYSSVSGTLDTYDSMTAGTSPSVAALPGGGYVVAFQAGGALWTYSSVSGTVDTYDSMTAGTSPSVAALPGGGYVVAFQAGGALWTYSSVSGTVDTYDGMMAGTSPSIGSHAAFQNQNGWLFTYSPVSGTVDTYDGMMAGTSPAIT